MPDCFDHIDGCNIKATNGSSPCNSGDLNDSSCYNRCEHINNDSAHRCKEPGNCSGKGCNRHCMINIEGMLKRINNTFLLRGDLRKGDLEMENKGKNDQPEDSDKRIFLKNACLMVGGALLGTGSLSLSGCSVQDDSKCTTTATTTTNVNNVEFLGECICPNCGISIPHPKGVPCRLIPCPKCSTNMGRLSA